MDEPIKNEELYKRLKEMNIYDLERLHDCFLWEYRHRPDDAVEIKAILDNIELFIGENLNK